MKAAARLGALSNIAERRKTYKYIEEDSGKLPVILKLAYAFPSFGTTSLTLMISVYVMDYFNSLGADLRFVVACEKAYPVLRC